MKEGFILNINVVKNALIQYLHSITDENVRIEIFKSIDDCNELINTTSTESVCLVSPFTLSTLLNLTTYNDYGKLKRQTGNVTPEQYYELVRNNLWLDEITDSNLQLGYYLVRDLWNDNEHFGHNNPDGTIKTK